ncbi:consensus disorder prediction [Desulfoluna spongiiphila]|nr:consensus disorder prediction [Desulfoluna spongiiphila]
MPMDTPCPRRPSFGPWPLWGWMVGLMFVVLLLSGYLCHAQAEGAAAGITPAEGCGCPPDTDDYKKTYGLFDMQQGKGLVVNLQGWSRIGVSEGAVPSVFGYLGRDGTELREMVGVVRAYGTGVDLVIDLGLRSEPKAQADGGEAVAKEGEGGEKGKEGPGWLKAGEGAWVEEANAFSIANLAEEIDLYARGAGCDGVLLRFPMAYIGDYFNVTATDSEGKAEERHVLPRQRVMDLIYKLKKMETYKGRGLRINLCLTDCQDAKEDSVLYSYLEKLLAEVDFILLDMAVLMKNMTAPKLNEALWQYYSPLVSLKEGNRSKMYHVMSYERYKTLHKKDGADPMDVARVLGFGGLAMELTEETASVFLEYNRARLEDQGDFFAEIVWKSGVGNALCSKRYLIKGAAWALGLGLLALAGLACWFWPVCNLLERFYYVVIGAGFLFAGLVWLYEAVNPTENNWTNETAAVILATACVVFVLIWLRIRQRAGFP